MLCIYGFVNISQHYYRYGNPPQRVPTVGQLSDFYKTMGLLGIHLIVHKPHLIPVTGVYNHDAANDFYTLDAGNVITPQSNTAHMNTEAEQRTIYQRFGEMCTLLLC